MKPRTFDSAEEITSTYSRNTIEARTEKMAALGLNIAEGRRDGSRVFDTDGKEYIDCYCSGGQFVLGRHREDMTAALREAVKKYDIGNFLLLSAQKASLAKMLARVTPGDLIVIQTGILGGLSA
ncbi:MAG TPA: aminotransferase class III-fold pyridoxal phosphate-dependent enzyme, partial [bacterium]|nr:aminotransferase class III-fold pyridoxal phosphate-dependent enzyme [bacterium]